MDASVAAKWYLPEIGSQQALELQEGPDQLLAPDLIRLEVAASITRRVRAARETERLSAEEALSRCGKWFRLLDQAAIALIPEGELLVLALKLSVEIKHTLQDCLYLAAAQQLHAPLVTADKVFQERTAPYYPRISPLPGCGAN